MSVPSADLDVLKHDVEQLAHQLPRSASKDEALEIAIKAAELSMRALKLAQDPNEKAMLSTRAKQLIADAEKIKRNADWKTALQSASLPPLAGNAENGVIPAVPRSKALEEPKSVVSPSRKEQILLLRASYLNGSKFPPWTTAPDTSEFVLNDGEELFQDATEFPLSEFQADVLDAWKRPADALPPPSWFSDDRTNLGPYMEPTRKIDLVQDAATDCSVVASLCAGAARASLGHQKIMSQVIYPYNAQSEAPQMSKNGKYVVRLNFNGCYRRVVIDDRLPTSATNRVIHVVDKCNPGLLWPALLEKAYLKVRGGYDFPGSNSATDLWILTGWIPEQVFLQSDDLEPDQLWRRISNGHKYGDVMITMGTGKMSSRTEREIGLAAEHDYAVLELREVNGQRLLLVKNPWCEGTSWRGKLKGSEMSSSSSNSQSLNSALIDFAEDEEPVNNSRDLLNSDDKLSPGTFWMDIDNVIQHFDSIYLNWNPGLFASRQDVHFAWDLSPSETTHSKPRGRYASLSRHPQYTVSTEKGGTIWILLWRHFQNAVPADATAEEIEEDRYGIELSGHISLSAFSSNGRRVLLPDRATEKGWLVDSPQTLLKLDDCKPHEVFTVVPSEQGLPATSLTFTLAAFGDSAVTLDEAKTRYTYSNMLSGAWTKETGGGNAHSPIYSTNPQFALTLTHPTSLSLLLEAQNDNLNVHVKLVYNKGARIHAIRNRDILVDSKDYRRGACLAEIPSVDPGAYTIICSTFEPHQLGPFTLLIESSHPTTATPLPREGAGRIRTPLAPAAFPHATSRIAAPLVPRRLCKLYALARFLDDRRAADGAPQLTPPSNRSLVRLTLEIGRGPHRRILIASGDGGHSDSVGGLRTEDVDLSPDMRREGDLWIVLDRMYGGAEGREERFGVELFADQPDAVSCGVWRDLGE